jgi:hypothetical protein
LVLLPHFRVIRLRAEEMGDGHPCGHGRRTQIKLEE